MSDEAVAFWNDAFKQVTETDEWKTNYQYLTELVMVLNWKLWQHYELGNNELSDVYQELWETADDYAMSHLKGEELNYFIRTTD